VGARKPFWKRSPVDERLLVSRYTQAGWPVARCARAAGIPPARAKSILRQHGVELREPTPPDEARIVAAYQRHRSVALVTVALGVDEGKVRAALDAHGVERGRGTRPVPALGRWVTVGQAARLLGKPQSYVAEAVAAGLLGEYRDDRRYRRYLRSDVEALKHRPSKPPAGEPRR
jgi:excisionase family DNA binding protein